MRNHIHRQSSSSLSSYWESQGDYQADEKHLFQQYEEGQLPHLYSNQAKLPTLPVPEIKDTMDKFLPTALPLCRNEKERKQLEQDCAKFPKQAEILQQRLQERAKLAQRQQTQTAVTNLANRTSWLQLWWNTLGYLQYRESNAIYVSYFFREAIATATDNNQNNNSQKTEPISPMAARGAAVLRQCAILSQDIVNANKQPDVLGRRKIPLCSTQYKYVWSASRIPKHKQDAYRVYYDDGHQLTKNTQQYNGPKPKQLRHAVVALHNQFYHVDLYHPQTGQLYSQTTLEQVLQQLLSSKSSPLSLPPPLGWMTSTHRDDWSDNYQLLQQHPHMAEAIENLQSGLFLLALDQEPAANANHSHMKEHDTASVRAAQLLHGNKHFTGNRWFDKSMQIVVGADARLGYIGEHSMADGMPAVGIWQHLLKHTQLEKIRLEPEKEPALSSAELPRARPIFQQAWEDLSSNQQQEVAAAVQSAQEQVSTRIDSLQLCVLEFDEYTVKDIQAAGYPPDAFGQMAIQLAAARTFEKDSNDDDAQDGPATVATYESTQTRQFLHGRTETTRTVSPQSVDFVNAMIHRKPTDAVAGVRNLLEQACTSHVQYSRAAAQGLGVDRHFFGLSMLRNEGETLPDLFSNDVFQRSKTWRLSTSTLPTTAPGFGPVVDNGLGVGYDLYAANNSMLVFSISGWKKFGYGPTFRVQLRRALTEMAIFVNTNDTTAGLPQTSKL